MSTPVYYKESLDDLVCELGDEGDNANAFLDGLILSIEDMEAYHRKCLDAYVRLRERICKARAL